MAPSVRVILDYDGTLTAEETQMADLATASLVTLATEILHVSRSRLEEEYIAVQTRLLAEPHRYWWEVNGCVAAYCNEGAFLLNTITIQTLLRENPDYAQAVARYFPDAEYGPIVDCTNYLFHRHTYHLPPCFRPATRDVLQELHAHPQITPVILTNSKGDKVHKNLRIIGMEHTLILGDTRQYDMTPTWCFPHPRQGPLQFWPVDERYTVDLRRPVYYHALQREADKGERLVVVADTFSMPGALPLLMGYPFILLKTSYTPAWCEQVVAAHPRGYVLRDLAALPQVVIALAEA